ncbi:hypothetical protein H8356DRAFT_1352328 [Neocallimastix lanati (nom. inval.)]|nr:hypothetical protein H8356DRAFT_1352328 [Neocallimastix sp. JGI-2020a]
MVTVKNKSNKEDVQIDVTMYEDKNQFEIDLSRDINHERGDIFILDYLFYLQYSTSPMILWITLQVIIINHLMFSVSENFEMECIGLIRNREPFCNFHHLIFRYLSIDISDSLIYHFDTTTSYTRQINIYINDNIIIPFIEFIYLKLKSQLSCKQHKLIINCPGHLRRVQLHYIITHPFFDILIIFYVSIYSNENDKDSTNIVIHNGVTTLYIKLLGLNYQYRNENSYFQVI